MRKGILLLLVFTVLCFSFDFMFLDPLGIIGSQSTEEVTEVLEEEDLGFLWDERAFAPVVSHLDHFRRFDYQGPVFFPRLRPPKFPA